MCCVASSKNAVNGQRGAAREKVRAMQEAQRRKERRQRSLIITSAVVVAAILIGVVVFAVTRAQANQPDLATVVVPPGITDTGGITKVAAGTGTTPVKVVEYLDYQCPVCKQFDAQVGPYLKQEIAAGNVEMEYHPVNFLDPSSGGTRYSSRAGSAAYCTATNGGDIEAFSDTLYAEQPPENGQGLPNARLVEAARDAGASAKAEKCIIGETYTGYVTQQNDQAFKKTGDGPRIGGTPAVFVDGKQIAPEGLPTLDQVKAAIDAAKK